jgi:hypothetical protein
MIPREELDKTIEELNLERKATIAEFLYTLFKGKFIEIYMGDIYEEVSDEQISTTYPAVFSGKVIGAYRECLVLQGVHFDKYTNSTSNKKGKLIFINERGIRGLCEIDGRGIIDDIFLRSRDAFEAKYGEDAVASKPAKLNK